LASLLGLLDYLALALDACFAFGDVPISLDQVSRSSIAVERSDYLHASLKDC
jgi:hypothetical protein